MEEVEGVIASCRGALTFCPPGHPDRRECLDTLAYGIYVRYQTMGTKEDLEEVITYNREALTLCPPGHPNRYMSLNNLANMVFSRYQHFGVVEDRDEAIRSYTEALTLCPPGWYFYIIIKLSPYVDFCVFRNVPTIFQPQQPWKCSSLSL